MAGIQRHEALKDLSRHHHHALVVAMNLNRADGSDMTSAKEQVVEFWEQGGNQHFREEEEVLLPMYAKYKVLQDDRNVSRMLLEHVQIRMLVQRIAAGESDIRLFHELGALLKSHVQFEEQVLFSEIQDAVAEPDLFAIQHLFHEMP